MDSRERTLLVLDHKVGDRIPIEFWGTPSIARFLESELGTPYSEFLHECDVDLRHIDGPVYTGPPLEGGSDIWGVKRGVVSTGLSDQSECYNEVMNPPPSHV